MSYEERCQVSVEGSMPRVAKRSSKALDLPRWIPPQLTQLAEAAPSGPQWVHEIKLDGFRMAARIDRGRAQLLTRTGLDWTDKYPSVVAALAQTRAKTAYLDGELVRRWPRWLAELFADPGRERWRARRPPRLLRLRSSASGRARHRQLAARRRKEPLIAGTPGLQFNGHETGDGELL
jgi:hypothetical protein